MSDDLKLRQLKYKLGLPAFAHLPRCPAKSRHRAKDANHAQDRDWIEKKKAGTLPEGFVDHTAREHFCPECACKNVAGRNTAHYGYGWCEVHERASRLKAVAPLVAERHLEAIQQRNPFIYKDAERWLEDVSQRGDASERYISLSGEVDLARAQVQELLDLLRKNRTGSSDTFIGAIQKLCKELLDHVDAGGRDQQFVDQVISKLNRLMEQHEVPLTDTQGGRLVPVSDMRRMEMVRKMIESISKIVRTHTQIQSERFCSQDDVNAYFAALARTTKRVLRRNPDLFQEWVRAISDLTPPGGMGSNQVVVRL